MRWPDPTDEAAGPRVAVQEFADFYRGAAGMLIGFLIRQGAQLEVAREIVQEVMTQAYKRWDEIEHPVAWIHTAASRTLVRWFADIREDFVDEVPEPGALLSRSDTFVDWEAGDELLRILKALPPRQRQVFAWTVDGYTPAEIAEELGITPEAARASLKKARNAAAALVDEEELS